ncbi:MAG: hypothetical protein R2704_07170 [Microthrixaceae bacterium]
MTLKADEPYEGSTEVTNDYRCLVMDPELEDATALTGFEFLPDQNEYVHHADLPHVRRSRRHGGRP